MNKVLVCPLLKWTSVVPLSLRHRLAIVALTQRLCSFCSWGYIQFVTSDNAFDGPLTELWMFGDEKFLR